MKPIHVVLGFVLCSSLGVSASESSPDFRDCTSCPELVRLPQGRFIMGSPDTERERSGDESPMHEVTFSADFAIGKFEVTHAQFEVFVKETARQMQDCFWDPVFPRTPEHPAICLTSVDAEAYAEWLAQKTGKPYRLPSEAEWEYAVRGSGHSVYSFGDDPNGLCSHANTRVEGCNDGFVNTAPVGSLPPNALGLSDLHGNVWELLEDCVTSNYETAPLDGAAVTSGDCSKRIIRGGGWYNASTGHFRSANRGWLGRNMADVMTGFRIARDCSSQHPC